MSGTPFLAGTGTFTSGTTALSVPWPEHVPGDVGVLFVETANETFATPNGWTEVVNSPQGTGTPGDAVASRLAVYWRRALSAGETSANVANPGDHAAAIILTFRNCRKEGLPYEVSAGGVAGSAVTGVTIPGGTTTVGNCLIVAAGTNGTDSSSSQFSSWVNASLVNFAQLVSSNTASGNGGGLGIAAGTLVSAGAYSATTATLGTASVQGRLSFALMPPTGFVQSTGFWVASANTGGSKIAGSEERLLISPAAADYPTTPAGRITETSAGTQIKQQPAKDPRRRVWRWTGLPAYQQRFTRFITHLEGLLGSTRRTRGLSPWIYLKEDVTDELRLWNLDNSTATALAAGTLTDSTQTWTPNAAEGGVVEIISATTGAGQRRTVFSNSATVLYITPDWTVTPTGTVLYSLQFSEQTWIRVRVLSVTKTPTGRAGLTYDVSLEFVVDDDAFNALG